MFFLSEAMLIFCNMALKTNSGYNHFCLILFSYDANTHLGNLNGFDPFFPVTYFEVCSDLKCSLQWQQCTDLQGGKAEVAGTFISLGDK